MKKLGNLVIVLLFLFAFSGCGGGGGSSITPKEIAITKITAYATGKSTDAPTPADYSDAGIGGITNENVERMNNYVKNTDSADPSVWAADSDDDGVINALDDYPDDADKSINKSPVVTTQNKGVAEDENVVISLSGIDPEGDSLTYIIVTHPSHGTVSISGASATYTPVANYNGSDSFTFKANDGTSDSASATVNLTITAVDDAPIATKQSITTNEDTQVAVTLAGSDIDSDVITYAVVNAPTHGTLSGTAPNLTYTPNTDYSGSDSFTFKATANGVDSVAANVSISVTEVDPAITLSNTNLEVQVGTSNTSIVSVDSSTGAVVDSYSIYPNLPAGLSIDVSTGKISGKPTASVRKTTYTITATNAYGTDSATFDLISIKKLPLVIIRVEFNDFQFASDATTWSNKVFSGAGSVNDYYAQNSYNQFQFVKAKESYEQEDGVITVSINANHPGSENDVLNNYFLEVLRQTDKYIDFSEYDTDGNGAISRDELQIMTIVAGGERAIGYTEGVWAHAACTVFNITYDSVKLLSCAQNGSYSMFGERHKADSNAPYYDATIGIIVHELGHAVFALPDLYDIDYDSAGIGSFGLMGAGEWGYKANENPGTTPVSFVGWSKQEAGFIKPTIIKGTQDITLNEVSNIDSKYMRIETGKSGEYFMVENRGPGGYDAGLYILRDIPLDGSYVGGLLVTHIDEGQRKGDNSDNADVNHKLVDVVEANGVSLDGSGDSASDGVTTNLYYAGNNSELTPSTTPNTNRYDGSESRINITDISGVGSTMTLTIEKN